MKQFYSYAFFSRAVVLKAGGQGGEHRTTADLSMVICNNLCKHICLYMWFDSMSFIYPRGFISSMGTVQIF